MVQVKQLVAVVLRRRRCQLLRTSSSFWIALTVEAASGSQATRNGMKAAL